MIRAFQRLKISRPLKLVFGVTVGSLIGYSIQTTTANAYCCSSTPETRSTLPLSKMEKLRYAGTSEFEEALAKITEVVGNDHISVKRSVIDQHSDSDWQFYHAKKGEEPQAVIFPKDTGEVSAVMKIAHQYKVPVTAYSGGTSLEGQFTPVYGGISLDLNRMNKILTVHEHDLDVVVQPAVGWEELNDHLEDYKLVFGVDPGPGAAIGGMVNTCASGTKAYRYGPMRHNVLGLEVVLADGTIIRTRKRPRKSSAGYSLNDLIVGSEGTLAIVTEITLKLHPKPPVIKVGALSFPTIKDAAQTVQQILVSGRQLDAIEIMDSTQMHMVNNCGITSRKWIEDNTLLVQFAGPSKERVENDICAIMAIAKQNNASGLVFAKNKDEADQLWAARKNALYSLLYSSPKGFHTFGTDTAVPLSRLAQFINETHEEIKRTGLRGSVLGHVGDGNFHVSIAYDPKTEYTKVEAFADWIARRSIDLEGTCTGEHGIGMGKRELLLAELGDQGVDLMRQIKKAVDPHLILNPAKIFKLEEVEKCGSWTPAEHSGCQCH